MCRPKNLGFCDSKETGTNDFLVSNLFLKAKQLKRDLRSFPRDSSTWFTGVRRLSFDRTEKSQQGECRWFYQVIIKSRTHTKMQFSYQCTNLEIFPRYFFMSPFKKHWDLRFFVQNLPWWRNSNRPPFLSWLLTRPFLKSNYLASRDDRFQHSRPWIFTRYPPHSPPKLLTSPNVSHPYPNPLHTCF